MLSLRTMLSFRAIARRAPALALAAMLLGSALGAPVPARADPLPDPAARVQVVVKSVHIIDDHDGIFRGAGDMELEVLLSCKAKPTPCLGKHSGVNLAIFRKKFSANTGETVAFDDLVLPQPNELTDPLYGSMDSGYPLDLGQNYPLVLRMNERDGTYFGEGANMGSRTLLLTPENGWGIGTHKLYTVLPDRLGDFEIDVHDLPGSAKKRVCMVVQNDAPVPAGSFEVALRVDGVVPPDGRVTAPGLAPKSNYEACVQTVLPTSGQHVLASVVDEPRASLEYNETNNVYEQPYTAPKTAASPASTSGAAQVDLDVSAITVHGQVPDGKNACKGRVAVVVKNIGTADASDFTLRLTVDGAQVAEQAVTGVEAGQERGVRFEDVRLKKGEHTLTAIADPNKAVPEADEANNELKVTTTCRDDA